jgi:peptide/nickel transport system substrate-binding protein
MRKPKSFFKVIGSYSRTEKIISYILIAAFIAVGTFYVYDNFISADKPGAVNEAIYTEGFQNGIYRINPVYVDLNSPDRDVSKLVFRGLTKYDPETRKIISDMADVKISDDRLKYSFTLKENIFWHDGENLDASDVYFTYHDVIQNPDFQNPVIKANFDGVEINKIDDRTVEFVLSAPNSFFITNTTVGVLPEHVLSDVPVSDMLAHEFNSTPVGSGPYKISAPLATTMSGVTQVVLERFDGFYSTMPQIQKIRFYGYPTKTDLVDNKSSLNAIPKLTNELIDPVSDDDRFSLYGYSLPQYNAVFINMENPVLKSLKVRKGLRKAIHKDDFLDKLPNTIRVETPVLSLDQDEWRYAAGMDEARELLSDAGFNEFVDEDEEESSDSESEIDQVTSVEAEEEDATDTETETDETAEETNGEEEDNEPKYRKNAAGDVLEFRLITRLYSEGSYKYNEIQTVLNYLEKNWKRAGVKLNIEMYDPTTLQQKINDRDYDLLLYGQSLGYNLDLYGYWHSSQTGENGLNLSNYKSFEVDTLIEAVRNTFDDEEKNEKLEELAKVMKDDIPAIFLYRPVYYYASDGKVKGIRLEDMAFPADRFCLINDWYL